VRASLDIDGPSVVSVECAADEIPPFAPFLSTAVTNHTTHQPNSHRPSSITQEDHAHVAASA
jgi:acetolactate synthase I/II/III large subunit